MAGERKYSFNFLCAGAEIISSIPQKMTAAESADGPYIFKVKTAIKKDVKTGIIFFCSNPADNKTAMQANITPAIVPIPAQTHILSTRGNIPVNLEIASSEISFILLFKIQYLISELCIIVYIKTYEYTSLLKNFLIKYSKKCKNVIK